MEAWRSSSIGQTRGNCKHGCIKCKLRLTNLFASYSKMTGFADQEKTVGAVNVDHSRAFNTVTSKLQNVFLTIWMDGQLDD